ncbi:DUF4340 domain-containing protein [Myxococcota bacterium]|nr:DUF4340 domain-containing protein [Myxococcota bacterium]
MRQVIIYGVLLALALGGAWARWTMEPEGEGGDKVVLLAGEVEQIDSIEWKGEDGQALLTRKTDDHGAYLWVQTVKVEERKSPPTPPGEEPPLEPLAELTEKVEKKDVFKAGEKGDELLASFSPLLAIRRLDAVDPAKLAEIGLDAPKESLVVTRKGQAVTLVIGGEAYGTKDRYVRNEATGEIFLLDDQLLKSLEFAKTRLPDRDLWSLERPALASATLSDGSKSVEAVQKNPDDEAKVTWARAGSEAPDEQLATWMDKALKLKGTSYVDPEATDGPKDLQLRFRLTLTPTGKGKPETLEVLQDGAEGDYYGRSEHTRGLIKLLRAPTRDLVEDLPALVQ